MANPLVDDLDRLITWADGADTNNETRHVFVLLATGKELRVVEMNEFRDDTVNLVLERFNDGDESMLVLASAIVGIRTVGRDSTPRKYL